MSSTCSTSWSLKPFTPFKSMVKIIVKIIVKMFIKVIIKVKTFFSLSSINRERNSGLRWFKLRKYSKSPEMTYTPNELHERR